MASNGNGLKFSVANILVLFVLVAGVAATWGSTRSSLADTCERVKGIEAKIDDFAGMPIIVENLSKEVAHLSKELSDTRKEMARLREAYGRSSARDFGEQ